MLNGHNPNYIKIINWAWEFIPEIQGYKASYMTLFLGVIDSINRNHWGETKISYELLINKCGISKQVYLDGRQWLINHALLDIEFGKNGFQMAKFKLGIEVQKRTGKAVRKQTAINTSNDTSNSETAGRNHTGTITQLKTENIFIDKQLNIPFDTFWKLYNYSKGKEKANKLWSSLSDQERETAIRHIPAYVLSTPDKTYRKHPATYLRNKAFNDEIIENGNKESNHQNSFTLSIGHPYKSREDIENEEKLKNSEIEWNKKRMVM